MRQPPWTPSPHATIAILGLVVLLLALLLATAARAQHLALDPLRVSADPVVSRVTLRAEGMSAAQFDLLAPDGVAPAMRADGKPACVVNPAIDRWDGGFALLPVGCIHDECRGVRAVILTVGEGIWTPIPDGSWIAACAWRVEKAGALECRTALAAPPEGGRDVPLGCEIAAPCVGDANDNGRVTVDEAVNVVGNVVEGCR
jgi:hypothetical protein